MKQGCLKTGMLIVFCILSFGEAIAENKIIVENLNEKFDVEKYQVNCMYQDSIGFLWFGMANGLYKFDNSDFRYIETKSDNLIEHPYIKSIIEFKKGMLLLGTYDYGLLVYNTFNEKFEKLNIKSNADVRKIKVNCMLKDPSGVIWIGTKSGLFKLNELEHNSDSLEIKHFYSHLNPDSSLAEIMEIKTSSSGEVWFISMSGLGIVENDSVKLYRTEETNNSFVFLNENEILIASYKIGLNKFDRKKHTFELFWDSSRDLNLRGKFIYKDMNGNIWLSITNKGLFLLDTTNKNSKSNTVSKSLHQISNLNSNVIISLNESRDGTIFVCSDAGINTMCNNEIAFHSILSNFSNDPDYYYGIRAISPVRNDKVLLGTMGWGPNLLDLNNHKTKNIVLDPNDENRGKNIQAILKDHNNNYWFGTEGDGVFFMQSDITSCVNSTKLINYRAFPDAFPENSLMNDFIMCMMEDSQNNIWFGTWYGLSLLSNSERLKPDQSKAFIQNFLNSTNNDSTLSSNTILCMLQDNNGNIWVGTQNGLNKVVVKGNNYFFESNIVDIYGQSLTSKSITSIFQSKKGEIWFSTLDGGICLLNPQKMTYSEFNSKNGFADLLVNSISDDKKGNLWFGTGNGICRYNPVTRTYNIFKKEDGLNSDYLLINSKCKLDNMIVYGSDKGIVLFDPENVKRDNYEKNLVFTDIKIFNKSLTVGCEDCDIKKSLPNTEMLKLKHKQNFITFEFSTLNFTKQKDIQYSCIFEGIEDSWNSLGKEHKITYTNLPHGYYTFKVLAYDSGYHTNAEEISIGIRISPPYWKTKLAYIIYILLVILITYYTYRYFINLEKKKSAVALERLNTKKEHEIDLMKLRFFMNVSHEFRTPLTLISSPLETLLKGNVDKGKTQSYYQLMFQNVVKLKRLIDEMLELRKIDAGYLKVVWKVGNIIEFSKRIFDTFQNYAEKRNMQFIFNSALPELHMFFDAEKLDKVLFNLFSNAFKYTENGGEIILSISKLSKDSKDLLEKSDGWLLVKIKDSGIGIPKNTIKNIFERFQNLEENRPVDSASTGIGLSLAKELIDLHKGEITVESEENIGTTFCVYLPIYNTVPEVQEIEPLSDEDEHIHCLNESDEGKENQLEINSNEQKPIVIIAEDNEDLRGFLVNELQNLFEIHQCTNGEEGLNLTVQKIPDLVVTDIMMDKMDGITLCKKIKSDEKTSHIPVILLTAHHADKVKLDGFKIGADDYITKPFSTEILKCRINNLIKQRRRLRAKFSLGIDNDPSLAASNSLDSKFLKKFNNLIQVNMDNENIDSTYLASEMAMSRMQLYRKVKALTNHTVNNYVKTIRLNKAAQLLMTTDYQISEIAYKVGYSDPSNFTKNFSKHFNQSPTQFLISQKKNQTVH